MKWFYFIATATVALLTLSPYALELLPSYKTDSFGDKIVSYSTYASKIRSLDPATCGDNVSAALQGNFYEGLYTYHFLKRPPTVIPQLAESMPEISPDGLVYTIKLKKGVKYHRNPCFGTDPAGQPTAREVKAEDFVLAFKRIADFHIATPMSLAFIEDKVVGIQEFRDRTRGYGRGDFSRYNLPLEGVKALDEYTLQIRLTVPFPQLIYVLALNNYAPVPQEVLDYYLARHEVNGQRVPLPKDEINPVIFDYHAAVGTGAYYLEKYVDGGDVVLMRNQDFREETYPCEGSPGDAEAGLLADCGKKVPFIDVQVMNYVPEENPMWQKFLTRQVDMTGIPREVYSQVISPSKSLTDRWKQQGIELIMYSDPAVYWLAFNMEDPILGRSRSLRQALSLSFDVETYSDVLFNGRSIRALNTIPSTFEAFKEAGPSPYARYDLVAARQKLAQARQELVDAGVIQPGEDIPTLRVDLGGRDETERRMGEFIQKQFRQIGINVKIELNDWPTLQSKVETKQTQIYAMGWHADYPDPENFLQLYYTPNIKRGTNNTNYSNPEFDRLYEQVAVMTPSPKRTELYAKMINIISEDCPVLLLTEPISFVLYHDWIKNVKPHPIGYGMYKYRRIDQSLRHQLGGRE